MPFRRIDSTHPEDLWSWMDGQRKPGNELLAISHNANLSDGVMFPLEVDSKGRPIDAAWAQSRVNNEPLSEIQQLKGASETHPAFRRMTSSPATKSLIFVGRCRPAPSSTEATSARRSRTAWDAGDRGYNPYKFGVVGASDTHDTAPRYTQSNYFGGHGLLDATPQARLSGKE